MATITSVSFPRPATRSETGLLAEFRAFWRALIAKAFNPYRPELHYMRGPGPAWRAKHTALSPAVQSMLAEIRTAKARKSSPSA
jgi:hypothetical protein